VTIPPVLTRRGLRFAAPVAAGALLTVALAAGIPRSTGSNLATKCPIAVPSAIGSGVTVALVDTTGSVDNEVVPGVEILALSNDRRDHASAHATAVASIFAACAPRARLVAIDAHIPGSPFGSVAAKGVQLALDQSPDILLMAFGTPYDGDALRRVVARAIDGGTLVVAPAGNTRERSVELGEDQPAPYLHWNEPIYPAAYGGVLSVGSLDVSGGMTSRFSQSRSYVDVVAPGSGLAVIRDGGRVVVSGTSFAAPQVAALAALALESNPGMSAANLHRALRDAATPLPLTLGDPAAGAGRADARGLETP